MAPADQIPQKIDFALDFGHREVFLADFDQLFAGFLDLWDVLRKFLKIQKIGFLGVFGVFWGLGRVLTYLTGSMCPSCWFELSNGFWEEPSLKNVRLFFLKISEFFLRRFITLKSV